MLCQLLIALRSIAQVNEDVEFLIGILERVVEVSPDDMEARFSLAHKYSELGVNDLSLQHYLKIPFQNREGATWNNLGVAFDNFGMPTKSVEAYRMAEGMGETIAMSNLGYKFAGVGFVTEAQEICDRALKIEGYHKNVGHLLALLKDQPDNEDEKEKQAVKGARQKSEHYQIFGRAIGLSEPENIAERWQGPDCTLSLKRTGKDVSLAGRFERDPSPFAMVLAPGITPTPKVKYRVEYTGKIWGRAIEGAVARPREGEPVRSLLDSSDGSTKVLMILSDSGDEIRVIENPRGGTTQDYILKRIVSPS